MTRPTITVLCGSTRFRTAFEKAFRDEEHAGRICLSVPCFKDDPCCKTPEDHARLDALHRHKIDVADEVLILNVLCPRCPVCKRWWQPVGGCALFADCKDCVRPRTFEEAGYIGASTARELAYTRSLGKPVRFLNPEDNQK